MWTPQGFKVCLAPFYCIIYERVNPWIINERDGFCRFCLAGVFNFYLEYRLFFQMSSCNVNLTTGLQKGPHSGFTLRSLFQYCSATVRGMLIKILRSLTSVKLMFLFIRDYKISLPTCVTWKSILIYWYDQTFGGRGYIVVTSRFYLENIEF